MKFLFCSAIALLSVLALVSALNGCKKDNATPVQTTCDLKGTYSGTSTTSTGATASMTYILRENNFALSSVTPTSPIVTYGGYRNTCDSVFISVYYTSNSSYYLLKGVLLNNRTTISGTYSNLTTPSDFGTFSIGK